MVMRLIWVHISMLTACSCSAMFSHRQRMHEKTASKTWLMKWAVFKDITISFRKVLSMTLVSKVFFSSFDHSAFSSATTKFGVRKNNKKTIINNITNNNNITCWDLLNKFYVADIWDKGWNLYIFWILG